MLKHPWRSRFVSRLILSVSKPASERAAASRRLFPYGIADQLADPLSGAKRARLVAPVPVQKPKRPKVAPEKKPAGRQVIWYYNHRRPS